MSHKRMNPAARAGADRVRKLSGWLISSDNAINHLKSQRNIEKIASPLPVGEIILDVGSHEGRDTCQRPLLRLQYRDNDGALVVWTGYSHADAIAASLTWTRNGVRLVDLTGGTL